MPRTRRGRSGAELDDDEEDGEDDIELDLDKKGQPVLADPPQASGDANRDFVDEKPSFRTSVPIGEISAQKKFSSFLAEHHAVKPPFLPARGKPILPKTNGALSGQSREENNEGLSLLERMYQGVDTSNKMDEGLSADSLRTVELLRKVFTSDSLQQFATMSMGRYAIILPTDQTLLGGSFHGKPSRSITDFPGGEGYMTLAEYNAHYCLTPAGQFKGNYGSNLRKGELNPFKKLRGSVNDKEFEATLPEVLPKNLAVTYLRGGVRSVNDPAIYRVQMPDDHDGPSNLNCGFFNKDVLLREIVKSDRLLSRSYMGIRGLDKENISLGIDDLLGQLNTRPYPRLKVPEEVLIENDCAIKRIYAFPRVYAGARFKRHSVLVALPDEISQFQMDLRKKAIAKSTVNIPISNTLPRPFTGGSGGKRKFAPEVKVLIDGSPGAAAMYLECLILYLLAYGGYHRTIDTSYPESINATPQFAVKLMAIFVMEELIWYSDINFIMNCILKAWTGEEVDDPYFKVASGRRYDGAPWPEGRAGTLLWNFFVALDRPAWEEYATPPLYTDRPGVPVPFGSSAYLRTCAIQGADRPDETYTLGFMSNVAGVFLARFQVFSDTVKDLFSSGRNAGGRNAQSSRLVYPPPHNFAAAITRAAMEMVTRNDIGDIIPVAVRDNHRTPHSLVESPLSAHDFLRCGAAAPEARWNPTFPEPDDHLSAMNSLFFFENSMAIADITHELLDDDVLLITPQARQRFGGAFLSTVYDVPKDKARKFMKLCLRIRKSLSEVGRQNRTGGVLPNWDKKIVIPYFDKGSRRMQRVCNDKLLIAVNLGKRKCTATVLAEDNAIANATIEYPAASDPNDVVSVTRSQLQKSIPHNKKDVSVNTLVSFASGGFVRGSYPECSKVVEIKTIVQTTVHRLKTEETFMSEEQLRPLQQVKVIGDSTRLIRSVTVNMPVICGDDIPHAMITQLAPEKIPFGFISYSTEHDCYIVTTNPDIVYEGFQSSVDYRSRFKTVRRDGKTVSGIDIASYGLIRSLP